MSHEEQIVYDEGVCDASFTNGHKENDEVEYRDGQIDEQVKECANGNISITDNYVEGFFIESTSKGEVDGIDANDRDKVESVEHVNVDGSKDIESRDNRLWNNQRIGCHIRPSNYRISRD